MVDDSKHNEEATLPPDQGFGRSRNLAERACFGILTRIFGWFIRNGRLNLHYKNAPDVTVGQADEPAVDVTIHRLAAIYRMLRRPDLAIGECYVNGDWDVPQRDLAKTLGILLENDAWLEATPPVRFLNAAREMADAVFRRNNTERSRKNASHHYDIGNDLYELFLDPEMLYSCAFFSDTADTLEKAQINKLNVTLDRLDVSPGMKVLDVGCGWGAVTRALAMRGAEAVGITLADQQLALAERRLPASLRQNITYHLQDYRVHATEYAGTYDRVVSIGMFEHVGRRQFEIYFDAIRQLLKPGGRAVVHSIVKDTPSRTNEWIDKYIFPGGYIPRIEDMEMSAKSAGLTMPRMPFIHESRNYAETLRYWRRRFNARAHELDPNRYDEKFRRMWNFYLAGSEAAFDHLGFQVAQVVVANTASVTNRSRPQRRLPPARPIRQRKIERTGVPDQDRNPRQG